MSQIRFRLNGQDQQVDTDPEMPLLHVLREVLNLTGTKFGCGAGLCGACTVHIDGLAIRSCQMPLEAVDGLEVVTIEGLGSEEGLHPVQEAWIEEQVPQCGFCQSGMIMATAAFLEENPRPTSSEVKSGITNLCRCGTYPRIQKAVFRASDKMTENAKS